MQSLKDVLRTSSRESETLWLKIDKKLPFIVEDVKASRTHKDGYIKHIIEKGVSDKIKLSIEKNDVKYIQQLLSENEDDLGFNLKGFVSTMVLKMGGLPVKINGIYYYIFKEGVID